MINYPACYAVLKFKKFNKTRNANQHFTRFRATCANTVGDNILLLKKFVNSLSKVAFDWYSIIFDDSVKAFAEMEELFCKKFVSTSDKITISDLVNPRCIRMKVS